MMLVYVPEITNRLGYTLSVVFRYLLHTDYEITTDRECYLRYAGPRLHYAPEPIDDSCYVQSVRLLFETVLEEQELHCFQSGDTPAIYPVYNEHNLLDFDVFAAVFYMVSRYEEYLPHHDDEHGRFLTSESLAYRMGFLHKAVVDRWALMLRDALLRIYPSLHFGSRVYEFEQTVDIDAAWCYRYKGLFRTVTGFLRDALYRRDIEEAKRRIRVIRGREQDPFDTFDFIIEQSRLNRNRHLIFFVLIGDYSLHDKPANYHSEPFRELLKHLADHAKLGLHPTYSTLEEPGRVDIESRRLSGVVHREVKRSRFHFLRMQLPYSYTNLVRCNILNDYSMGFADTSGFRAGTCTPYPFYDLTHDCETLLMVHPFCTMDTTMNIHQKLTPQQAWDEYKILIDEVRSVGGTFCAIWHNQNLCDLYGWKGWRELYQKVLAYAADSPHPAR